MLKELQGVIAPSVISKSRQPIHNQLLTVAKEVYKKTLPLSLREKVWELRRREPVYPYKARVFIDGSSGEFVITGRLARIELEKCCYEREFLEELLNVLEPDDVFWDVGACRGLYTVLAARRIKGSGKVASIEPDPVMFNALQQNIAHNGVESRVISLPIALGNERQNFRLYTDSSPNGRAPSLRPIHDYADYLEVPCRTADSLVFSGEVSFPSVVKIDVEGAEGLVIEGMQNLLISEINRPRHLFVELHPASTLNLFGTNSQTVWASILNTGYTPVSVRERNQELLCHFTASS